ncbi:MAG: protein translocase subunit SecF [Acidobacteria bacterium]|nr:protein translocase subunit SecF [Acidobacteriota bacterium]
MEFFRNPKIDWIRNKWYFVGLSLLLSGLGVASLLVKGGPRYGIDFRGGTMVHVKFRQAPQLDRLRAALDTQGLRNSTLQRYGAENSTEILVGLDLSSTSETDLEAGKQSIVNALRKEFGGGAKPSLNEASAASVVEQLSADEAVRNALSGDQIRQLAQSILEYRDTPPRSGLLGSFDEVRQVLGVTPQVVAALQNSFTLSDFAVRNVEIVGPKVGAALRKQALNATLLALASMLIYIAFRFEWIYGFAAVIATLHDVIVAVGFLSLFNQEITLTVIAALLTLVGFSVNDTIVVFDRVRENVRLMRRDSISDIVNLSVNQTLSRTALTSGLTFLSVLALLLFGGEVLRGFAFTLVVGILVGTYSSIAVASTLVASWQEYNNRDRRGGRVVAMERDQARARRAQAGAKVKA